MSKGINKIGNKYRVSVPRKLNHGNTYLASFNSLEEALKARNEWKNTNKYVEKGDYDNIEDFINNCLYYKNGKLLSGVNTSKLEIGKEVGYKHPNGYIRSNFSNFGLFYNHRIIFFIFNKKWPENEIDHINGNKHDNRIENLRDIHKLKNLKNQRLRKNNKYGIIGVSFNKTNKKWRSVICINNKREYLYYGDCFFEACCARKSTEIKYEFHKNHGRKRLKNDL